MSVGSIARSKHLGLSALGLENTQSDLDSCNLDQVYKCPHQRTSPTSYFTGNAPTVQKKIESYTGKFA